jgi:hypothetical protein
VPERYRTYSLAAVSVVYMAFASLQASGGAAWGWVSLFCLPIALAICWWKSAPPPRGEDWVDPTTRSATRACAWGGALLFASRGAPADAPAFEAVANLATIISTTSAIVAIARISPRGGLLVVPAEVRRLGLAVTTAAIGSLTVALPAATALLPIQAIRPGPAAVEAAGMAAGLGSLVTLVAAALRVRRLRKLELGVGDRVRAAFAFTAAALGIGSFATLLRLAPASNVLCATSFIGAFATTLACLAREPTAVARAQRTVMAVTMFGAPIALLGASIAAEVPASASLLVIAALAAGIAIGVGATAIARPLGPEQSRWLDAIEAATRAAGHVDPETAVTSALLALRDAVGPLGTSPEIWRTFTGTVLRVDRAGYAQQETGVLPAMLISLAASEPEGTLSTAVIETLEVRRADVRPLIGWLRARSVLSTTVLSDEQGPIGALVLPAGGRTVPLTLEEARALRTLGDRLATLLSLSSALTRSRDREIESREQTDQQRQRAIGLQHALDALGIRYEFFAERMARSVLSACYSAAARFAVDQVKQAGATGSHVTLLAPAGVDPVPYAALAHLSGPRKAGPIVIVEGSNPTEQIEDSWQDPVRSPLSLANRGTIVLLSPSALSEGAQKYLSRSLATGRCPAGDAVPLDVALVVCVPATIDVLVASGHLAAELADQLGDKAVPLPPLVARPDDLRAIIMQRLARIGLSVRGHPIGVDPRALATLIEHGWPGNEMELDDVLTRAAAVADGDVLGQADLDRIGFRAVTAPIRHTSRPPSLRPRA